MLEYVYFSVQAITETVSLYLKIVFRLQVKPKKFGRAEIFAKTKRRIGGN